MQLMTQGDSETSDLIRLMIQWGSEQLVRVLALVVTCGQGFSQLFAYLVSLEFCKF